MQYKVYLRMLATPVIMSCLLFGQLHSQDKNKGYKLYEQGDKKDALLIFIQLIKVDSTNAEAHYMAGKCYLETHPNGKALIHLQKAYKLNKNISYDLLYKIANTYHLTAHFDDAIKYYNLYKDAIGMTSNNKISVSDEIVKAEKRISECNNAKIYYQNEYTHHIVNLGKGVNSDHPEYAPVITADNHTLYFTSKRPGGISDDKDKDNEYFEDIWVSKKVNHHWTHPHNIGKPINSNSHDGCIGISPNGKELFIFKNTNGGDIYYCTLKSNGSWSAPESISKKINSPYKEPSVSISSDGKTIYFSSNRPGGYGGMDLYKCTSDGKGGWNDAENLGSTINSEYDEDGPFIDTDNKTLYFSSTGHGNMGGYDIYKSAYDHRRNVWSEPENLGYPINTPDDDIYFVIAGDKKTAYYASEKTHGVGEKDLYVIHIDTTYSTKTHSDPRALAAQKIRIPRTKHSGMGQSFQERENQHLQQALLMTTFTGKVLDGNTNQPLQSRIIVNKVGSKEHYHEYKTNHEGNFSLHLLPGFDYAIDIEKEGHLFYSYNINLVNSKKGKLVTEKIILDKLEKGKKIVLKNVFYDLGVATLKPESKTELNILLEMMNKYPQIHMEISGHTDNLGTASINQKLSESRAKAVYDYLVSKGVDAARLTYVGYGPDRPLAQNNTDENRQKNRRTEFEITEF